VFNHIGLPCQRLGQPYLSTEIIYKYTDIEAGVAGGCAPSVITTSAGSGIIVCV
jgi:hypothetical protein